MEHEVKQRAEKCRTRKVEGETRPSYRNRKITCTACSFEMETRHMQLRTERGYWDLRCKECSNQIRCGSAKCQCNEVWPRCITHTHRLGPILHESKQTPKTIPIGIGGETVRKRHLRRETAVAKLPYVANGYMVKEQNVSITCGCLLGKREHKFA